MDDMFVCFVFNVFGFLRMHQTICFVMLLTKFQKYVFVLNDLEEVASETLQIVVLRTHLRKY